MADVQALRNLIYTFPLIDNHAHNILKLSHVTDYEKYPFESITSEAQGDALLSDTRKSLPHLKATSQLAEFYRCAADWDAIKAARQQQIELGYEQLIKRCLQGTHMLLLDDGLNSEDVEPYNWHDRFTPGPTKRVVRIEALAASIMKDIVRDALGAESGSNASPATNTTSVGVHFEKDVSPGGQFTRRQLLSADQTTIHHFWTMFERKFKGSIDRALVDPVVAGFKSVICYRTGLTIDEKPVHDVFKSFNTYFHRVVESNNDRIDIKPLNDYLVLSLLDRIQQSRSRSKPFQLHTGLGDADILLQLSNPALLQPLIEKYDKVDFVLLHSSYPFTREAGYLASTYRNAYLDIGEVFPMISRDGQGSILRQCLELTPTSKILWSTDGHYHPETYWLSNLQFRQTLESVFTDYLYKGDHGLKQAMDSVKDILFYNSNRLYSLNQTADVPTITAIQEDQFPLLFRQLPLESQAETANRFELINTNVDFFWLQWVDYTATVRVRMVPRREFRRILEGKKLGITLAVMSLLQNDIIAQPPGNKPNCEATGQMYLQPDVTTLSPTLSNSQTKPPTSATVMTFWKTLDGMPQEGCPRALVQKIADKIKVEFGISLLVGFELEVVLMERSEYTAIAGNTIYKYKPWLNNHSWSNMTSDTRMALPLLEEIVCELSALNIEVEQFHAESCPGQFEFVLPPARPLAAIDTLIKARQVVVTLAEKHGLRATLYPRPVSTAAGNGAHVHLSITPTTQENNFLAGMLKHFQSIMAFTLPQAVSYERVKPSVWAGGTWVAWGEQNRETPIRKIDEGHWEIKSMDGLANPYLGVAAILGAGYLGMKEQTELATKPCNADPATLSNSERTELGITWPLPTSIEETLEALEANSRFIELLGKHFVSRYINVRRAENEMLSQKSPEERRAWLIGRY